MKSDHVNNDHRDNMAHPLRHVVTTLSAMLSQPHFHAVTTLSVMLSQPPHYHVVTTISTLSVMLSQPSLPCCHNHLCHVVTTLSGMLSQPSLPCCHNPRCHVVTTFSAMAHPFCHVVTTLTATTLTLPYCHNLWLHTEQHLLTCRLKLPKRDGCGLRTSVRDSAVRHVHKACHARCERHDSLEISLPHLQRGLLGSSKFGDGMIITVKINPRCL